VRANGAPALRRKTALAAEQFWIVKHGVKMTGMAAWGLLARRHLGSYRDAYRRHSPRIDSSPKLIHTGGGFESNAFQDDAFQVGTLLPLVHRSELPSPLIFQEPQKERVCDVLTGGVHA
jgi:hypothetical protein